MRMENKGGKREMTTKKFINQHLNTDAYRVQRPAFTMLGWHAKGKSAGNNVRERAVLAKLSQAQIAANTTRGTTPGLVDPALGEAPGNRIALPVFERGKGKKRGPNKKKAEAQKRAAPKGKPKKNAEPPASGSDNTAISAPVALSASAISPEVSFSSPKVSISH